MARIPEEAEFERLLEEYSLLITARVRAFDHGRAGIDRDDLLQEIRLRIWRSCGGRYGRIRHWRAYISRIVHNTVLKEIGKERTQKRAFEKQASELSASPPGRESPEPASDSRIRDALRTALNAIPRANAEVIRLHLRGFDLAQIATLKGYSLPKTRHLYYRGLNKLKEKIEIDGEIA